MALSVKFALLTCLLFTGGMCWLVNQVSRAPDAHRVTVVPPETNRPSVKPVVTPPSAHPPISIATERDLARSSGLERPSPVARSQDSAVEQGTIVDAVASPEIAGDVSVPPPPISNALLEMRSAAEDATRAPEWAGNDPAPTVWGQIAEPDKVDISNPSAAPSAALQSSTVYTVKKGDSLTKICREFYGDKLSEGKKLVLAENPKIGSRQGMMLHLGELLQIPPLDGANGMALDAGGMEATASNTIKVLPEPVIPDAVQSDPTHDEVPVPKLTQNNTRKSASKKTPAKTSSPPSNEQRKVKPSSPKPAPPSSKFAMNSKPSTGKVRTPVEADASRKSTVKPTPPKSVPKAAATRKNAAAISPKPSVDKRPMLPAKKNARRASLQDAMEPDSPVIMAMIGER